MNDLAHRHFDFGRNWRSYAKMVDPPAIQSATDGLTGLLPAAAFRSANFLDIGCGSGIHSIAAARLGAEVTAIDADADSVATTRALAAQSGAAVSTHLMSVFDARLGEFDIVYSWGVPHHTGDMWRAIECAASHVAPGGHLVLALYRKTKLCGLWRLEKRVYSKAPRWLRAPVKWAFGALLLARGGQRPNRGMDFWHDVEDWLGGYPYESASPREVIRHASNLGLWLVKTRNTHRTLGLFGTGCAEYVFQRPTSHIQSPE